MRKKEMNHEIIKEIGEISEKNGYAKAVCVIAWNERPATYDIRNFKVGENGTKHPLKGISLSKEEVISLRELLSNIVLEV